MSSDSESIAQRLHGELDALIRRVSEIEGKQPSIRETEEQLWTGMLALGRGLMQLRFEACSAAEVRQDAIEVQGIRYAYQHQSSRAYVSLFGEVRLDRAYYWNPEYGGVCPLDAGLSMPGRRYSDSVQERLSEMNVWVPQEHSLALFERWLGVKIPKGSLQNSVSEQALYVEDYYAQHVVPTAPAQDTVLVVTADGKGIPMTRQDSPPPADRRGRGQPKTAKKEAVVTALYSVAPYVRDSQAILAALLPEQVPQPTPPTARPALSHKQTFGTLEGKTAAMNQLAIQVARRDPTAFAYRVALSDGAVALQQHLLDHFPDFTLVLDIIHVTEYVWDAANARWGETSPDRQPWVKQALTWLLTDQLDALLHDLETPRPELSAARQDVLAHVSAYFRRNRSFMDYQRYLALGWPIGTGIVEGACAHLVKDRFEQSGMQWSFAGAQSLLDLRSVAFNGDWDDFQRFRRRQVHRERYHTPYPEALPDIAALEAAA
jgi:hypothetical protein